MELARELHRPVVKRFKVRRVITHGIDHIWEADLLLMKNYSAENKGYNYILNIIDCFSKFAWCIPLRTKSGAEVSAAFEQILKKKRPCRRPTLLHTDKGGEFVNNIFKSMLSRYKIKMYHTFTVVKASMVERFNRTLNQKFKIHFEANKNHNWLSILRKLVKQYNEQDIHRTIGMPPAKVTSSNESEVLEKVYNLSNFKLPKPTLKLGDRVRTPAFRCTFANKYSKNWTDEVFIVHKIHYTVPITYTIRSADGEVIQGKFYRQELLRSRF